jgi:hypothetical protein
MSTGLIGKISLFSGSTDAIRQRAFRPPLRTVGPVTAPSHLRVGTQGRATGVVIDLRPDAAEDTVRPPTQNRSERIGQTPRPRSAEPATDDKAAYWTYPASSDTPYRRRTYDEIYEAAEALDAWPIHRGGIVDLQI